MKRIIQFGQEKWTGDPKQDIPRLAALVSKEFDNVYRYLFQMPDVSGTFKSADAPAKDVTVTTGAVSKITTEATAAQPSIVASVAATSALLVATITNPSSLTVTKCGFYCDTSPTPSQEHDATTVQSGDFGLTIKGLQPATVYYAQAFVTTSSGTAVSGISSFTTQS